MVTKRYELETPPPPSEAKRYVDQKLIPTAIDVFGDVEVFLARIAAQIREQPLFALQVADRLRRHARPHAHADARPQALKRYRSGRFA